MNRFISILSILMVLKEIYIQVEVRISATQGSLHIENKMKNEINIAVWFSPQHPI